MTALEMGCEGGFLRPHKIANAYFLFALYAASYASRTGVGIVDVFAGNFPDAASDVP